jgi:hypothetical protein
MVNSLTICDFLEQGGAQVSFFDMGRRVVEIPLDVMRSFESAETPYPQPFLQHAWLGIVFQYPDSTTDNQATSTNPHNIWFVKLPLDEQGLLQQAARDDFLRHILKSLDDTLDNSNDKNLQQQTADDNPHGFTPREDRMAVFHAKISKQSEDPPSQFYAHAMDYFAGTAGFEQWNFVGLQGIADVAARLDENTLNGKTNAQILVQAIPQIPVTPFAALCSCLESVEINAAITQEIAARITKAIENNDVVMVAAGTRGLSHSTDRNTVIATIISVLKTPAGQNVEVLAAIAGRAWEALENHTLRFLFLENLALCEAGQQAFNSIMADLLFLPKLRPLIKEDFRKPERSKRLATAIRGFLEMVKTK